MCVVVRLLWFVAVVGAYNALVVAVCCKCKRLLFVGVCCLLCWRWCCVLSGVVDCGLLLVVCYPCLVADVG